MVSLLVAPAGNRWDASPILCPSLSYWARAIVAVYSACYDPLDPHTLSHAWVFYLVLPLSLNSTWYLINHRITADFAAVNGALENSQIGVSPWYGSIDAQALRLSIMQCAHR